MRVGLQAKVVSGSIEDMPERGINELPPPNPAADGLFLTDDEWAAVLGIVAADPIVVRAWIFGSRVTGVRREKPKPEPLDIDVFYLLNWTGSLGSDIEISAAFKSRHAAVCDRWQINLHEYGRGSASDEWVRESVQIWPRDP